MTTIMFPVDRSAQATRRRLLRPAGGRVSTELEITTAPELRRARIKEALQQEAERRSSALSEAIAAARKRAEDARRQRELSTDLKSSLVPNIPTINAIITAVSDFYRINLVDMISQRRTADLVRARQTAMWIARFLTVRSTPQIGRAFGGRDHTTVLHALRKIDERLMNEPGLAGELRSICATLQVASPRALDQPENAEDPA